MGGNDSRTGTPGEALRNAVSQQALAFEGHRAHSTTTVMTEAGRHPWYDASGTPIPPVRVSFDLRSILSVLRVEVQAGRLPSQRRSCVWCRTFHG